MLSHMSMIGTSRRLRRDATQAEKLLWSRLRDRQLGGAKFRRQNPLGPYVVDFFCLKLGLVIELDGGQHAVQAERDQRRDRWLESEGYRVLRFWNHEVMGNIDGVLQRILESVERMERQSS
ncbi:MAG: endonuclease domain-containing protein [Kiloniellales bacterium]